MISQYICYANYKIFERDFLNQNIKNYRHGDYIWTNRPENKKILDRANIKPGPAYKGSVWKGKYYGEQSLDNI